MSKCCINRLKQCKKSCRGLKDSNLCGETPSDYSSQDVRVRRLNHSAKSAMMYTMMLPYCFLFQRTATRSLNKIDELFIVEHTNTVLHTNLFCASSSSSSSMLFCVCAGQIILYFNDLLFGH